jgi:hypothetical protein
MGNKWTVPKESETPAPAGILPGGLKIWPQQEERREQMSKMKDYLLDSYDHISGDCPVTDCLVCAVEKAGHERQRDDTERKVKKEAKRRGGGPCLERPY